MSPMRLDDIAEMPFSKATTGWTGDLVSDGLLELISDGTYIAEAKEDGSRYRFATDGECNSRLLSRRISAKTGQLVDKVEHVPHIIEALEEVAANSPLVLEAEVINIRGFESVASVMNSTVENALRAQLDDDDVRIRLVIHDILLSDGVDHRNSPYHIRRGIYETIASLSDHPDIDCVDMMFSEAAIIDYVRRGDTEGLMLKKPGGIYGESGAMAKFKKTWTEDVYVIGYEKGKGKYTGVIGYLITLTNDKRVVRVGSGLTDEQRKALMELEPPYVIEIKHYGRQKKSVRHPVFLRSRFQDSIDIPQWARSEERKYRAG